MPSLNVIRASNSQYSPNYLPVAVFLGGTAGIGLGMARALANATNGNCHIIILGRNRSAAEIAISSFPKPTALGAKHEFIPCDATLMKNVRAAAQEIRSRVSGKINFVVTSPMLLETIQAEFTEEGIEKKLALLFYARGLLVQELIPLLIEAKKAGEDAKFFNVGAGAQHGGKLDRSNLGLKRSFNLNTTVKTQAPTWTNLLLEHFASENPGIEFLNGWPGFVNTNLWNHGKNSWILWLLGLILTLFGNLFGTSPDVSGEYMLYALLRAQGGGVKFIAERGDEAPPMIKQYAEGDRQVVWEHFAETTSFS